MHVGAISFCGSTAFNVKSDDDKRRVLEKLEHLFGRRVVQRHYQQFSNASLRLIRTNPYMVCVRTNGNPYFLLLSRHLGVPTCFFIDKKVQNGYFFPRVIVAKLCFDEDMFGDTLLDGEMVKDRDGEWTFLVHDIIGINGVKLGNTNLVRRLNVLHALLDEKYRDLHGQVCHVRVKRHVPLEQCRLILEMLPTLRYACRGLYVRPLFMNFPDILANFDDTVVRKPTCAPRIGRFITGREEQVPPPTFSDAKCPESEPRAATAQGLPKRTLHVKNTSTPDVYDVYDGPTLLGQACVASLRTSKMLRTAFDGRTLAERIPFRCVYDERFRAWTPVDAVVNDVSRDRH